MPPQPAQGVVGQEGDDVARGVELVAEGQLVAVARRAGGLAGLIAQFGRGEELVDPADGLVLGPGRLQLRGVEEGQHLLQARLGRKQDRGGQGAVEEHAQGLAQVVEEKLQVEPVAAAGPESGRGVGLPAHGLGRDETELLEAFGAIRLSHGGLDQRPAGMLHQLKGSQTVEEGEGALADVALHRFLAGCAGCFFVRDSSLDGPAVGAANGVQVSQALQRLEGAAGVDAVGTLQLPGQVFFQPLPAPDDRRGDHVAQRLVHLSHSARCNNRLIP